MMMVRPDSSSLLMSQEDEDEGPLAQHAVDVEVADDQVAGLPHLHDAGRQNPKAEIEAARDGAVSRARALLVAGARAPSEKDLDEFFAGLKGEEMKAVSEELHRLQQRLGAMLAYAK